MEINNIEKLPVDISASKGIRDTAPPSPPPRRDSVKVNSESSRPVVPRRPQALMNAVTQGLNQAGLETSTTTAIQETKGSEDTQTENTLETNQNEKVARALQAFIHSLVQAMNTRNIDSASGAQSATSSIPFASSQGIETSPQKYADAYGGLVSRLEGLARRLEGTNSPSNGDSGLDQLNGRFEDLANAITGNDKGRQSESPKLQTMLQNMIRNLQSTGDPTLASTGNVINTAA